MGPSSGALLDPDGYERLSIALAALWRHEPEKVRSQVNPLIKGTRRPAVALAYRSLAHRMESDFERAIEEAQLAVELDSESAEALFALSACYLSLKDVEDALATYAQMKRAQARDPGGHFMKVLGFVLYAECIAGMEDDGKSIRVDFRQTPCTRAALRILDGYPRLALGELDSDDDGGLLPCLAAGLAGYCLGSWKPAEESLSSALRQQLIEYDTFRIAPSVHWLLSNMPPARRS